MSIQPGQLSIDGVNWTAPAWQVEDLRPALARHDDPTTSKLAAKSIGAGAVAGIMAAFEDKPDWTASELAERLDPMHPPTVASALSRLGSTKDGRTPRLVRRGDQRLSDRGAWQDVWVLHPGDAAG